MKVEVRSEGFDPLAEVAHYQASMATPPSACGASALFIGTMRDFNEGNSVQAMTLEHYPGMTEQHLHAISEEAARRWDIEDTLIIHRVGRLRPADPIVVVAVWAAHRAAAFDACRYLIEELKARAPFWKKEQLASGARWVEKNTAS
ncbi:MAG: molybdenum cofactor biosynthesis protein MoaE [Pseudomonadota bacterium]|nr:MAG: molybdenum cofactor biosynthesis protein MoaE [Pseudomonadota bacterium]